MGCGSGSTINLIWVPFLNRLNLTSPYLMVGAVNPPEFQLGKTITVKLVLTALKIELDSHQFFLETPF